MVISGETWDTNFFWKYFFAHELHEWTRRLCDTRMATGSVALIYTNAMRGRYDDNGDNLGQLEVVFCGCNGNASKFLCPRIARIDTNSCNGLNGDRVGRTNLH